MVSFGKILSLDGLCDGLAAEVLYVKVVHHQSLGSLFAIAFLSQPKNEFHPMLSIVVLCQILVTFYALDEFSGLLWCL